MHKIEQVRILFYNIEFLREEGLIKLVSNDSLEEYIFNEDARKKTKDIVRRYQFNRKEKIVRIKWKKRKVKLSDCIE